MNAEIPININFAWLRWDTKGVTFPNELGAQKVKSAQGVTYSRYHLKIPDEFGFLIRCDPFPYNDWGGDPTFGGPGPSERYEKLRPFDIKHFRVIKPLNLTKKLVQQSTTLVGQTPQKWWGKPPKNAGATSSLSSDGGLRGGGAGYLRKCPPVKNSGDQKGQSDLFLPKGQNDLFDSRNFCLGGIYVGTLPPQSAATVARYLYRKHHP